MFRMSLCLAGLSAGFLQPAYACEFAPWLEFNGTELLRHADTGAYLYVVDHKAVDADGAPNAYHPDDAGKSCRNDDHIGLDCTANAGYNYAGDTSGWGGVLVADPEDDERPFVQTEGEFAGYFVSQTWLFDGAVSERTDPARYVDATRVPYIVFPNSEFYGIVGTGLRGDVGFALNVDTGAQTAFVVADLGGGEGARLGEASIALYSALGGTDPNPRTGAGLPQGDIAFVVFPYSSRDVRPKWPRTQSDLQAQVVGLMAAFGGEAQVEDCAAGLLDDR